ncbi:general secretion pathway protein GspD [Mucilaginibacter mali]|uniref:General secretion pathway protein GspD n=1 Tax=Mucilaginibacter mali TaxID=2740462 RepID=A0A7D4UE04_9SPHI|nr:general secretion pathway protein GspD [Mucilaginibacter mali]QKJ31059.1 general secretion pathway protein GspD [Mucilaginibacter mali]
MHKKLTLFLIILSFFCTATWAQQKDRIQVIQQKLETLAQTVPGLNQKVQLSIANVSIQDYLNAISKANAISMSIDPKLNMRVNNNLTDVTAINVLVFLAGQYNLDISIVGSILVIAPYQDPNQFIKPPLREIPVRYDAPTNNLSLELANDSLITVAKKITRLSGKNVVVPTTLQGKRVNGYFASAPFDMVLEKLAYSNELKMQKTADGFYLFQPLADGEELYVTGDHNTAVRRVFKPVTPNTTGGGLNIYSKMVGGQKLLSADVSNGNILDLVRTASQEMNKSYFLYSDLKGTITVHANDLSYDDFLSAIFRGTEYTFHVDNGIYMMGSRKLEGLRTNKIVALQNRSIDTVMAMIPREWMKDVEIKEFREQNTLLLSGSAPQIRELETYINQLDKIVPMVMIEITLVDINKSRTVATGLKVGVADSAVKSGGTLLSGFDFTFSASSINGLLDKLGGSYANLGHVVPNFYASIKALESLNNVEVHSIPKLTTLNGHAATSSIGSRSWYLVQTQNVIPSISSPTINYTQQYNSVDANMIINIKPIVSGDDQVTLGIKIDITDFNGTPPANSPPPTSTSKFESIVRAHNEDMIVLGGLERTIDSDNSSGTPLLSRIPVIKWFFSTKTKTHQKVVTLVFIKPTIIR